jgi:FAD/FMN-containing dehydrogenase
LTGLAGGGIPFENDLCLALERMRGVEEIDESAATMTVRAGTPLQTVQEAAAQNGFEFPLDMGSRGSCQIGGVIATNAGGIRVVRYGTARDQVLGLEVVLADGTILNSMNKMLKNNTGYDLKHWFIGSEGTLGVITRAVLRLRAKPPRRETALCGLDSYEEALRLLHSVRNGLTAFELMWKDFVDFAGRPLPFEQPYPLYALVEQETFTPDERFVNAAVSTSVAETRALWKIREAPTEFASRLANPINYDVSLPIGSIGDFVEEAKPLLPCRSLFFGHIADSNLHVTLDFADNETADRLLYSLVERYRGSISAEHGIGLFKRDYLHCSRTEAEIETMRIIKKALDPRGILNPGKIFRAS